MGNGYQRLIALGAGCMLLASCSDNSDSDGDGKVSTNERATEMVRDGYLAMSPGRWQTKVVFTDIDVPKLSMVQRQQIIDSAGKETIRYSCLSKAEAAKPGPDFFGGAGAENCNYTRFDLAGNNADMALSCKMGGMGKADMELKGVFATEDFSFDTKVSVQLPMVGKTQKITMTGTMSGKFEGQCKGDE
jgi:Protein of unknown function (DUF3617)